MKRKLLPVFLSFALLANGSLTAFATDSSVDTVTESDAQTTVSEDQENPEETTQEEVSEDEAVPADESDAITDFETAYKAYTFGANVSGPDAISADKNTVAVLDVRSSVNYDISHLEGSFSTPVFNEDGSIIQTSEDATAKAFTKTVTNNANFQNKELYLLCNSGARGAAKATQLLKEAGITNVFTIENGAKSEVIQKHFVTDPVADPDTKKDNNGKDNNKNLNNGKTTTAATTKTGDTAPIAALAVAMLAALGAIIAFGKKKIVK